MSHSIFRIIEVALNDDDGTYRLQVFPIVEGAVLPVPRATVAGHETIQQALRELADLLDAEGAPFR